MDSGRNNSGRGRGRDGGGRGRDGGGRGRNGGGRGGYQNQPNQGGGRGRGAPIQANQPPPQQAWGNRPPVQANQPQPPVQQAWGNRTPVQANQPQPPVQQAWGNRPPVQANQPPSQPRPQGGPPAGGRGGPWAGRPWGPSTTPPASASASASASAAAAAAPPPQPSVEELDIQSLKISEQRPPSSSVIKGSQVEPIKRPDRGGTISIRTVRLLVNHFPVKFDPKKTIMHYNVDVKPAPSTDNRLAKRTVRKCDLRVIRDKLFSDVSRFPVLRTAYDGEKNIFSAVVLPTGQFQVDVSDEDGARGGSYIFTIKFVSELKLSKLEDYLIGKLSYIPRDILQGMDLVMKENPTTKRICVGRGYYSKEYRDYDDLRNGVAPYRGFQQSLKPTSQGLALCLDYSVMTFRKPWPVIDFLMEHLELNEVSALKQRGRDIVSALKGLKVRVIHRPTKQKYTVAGLSKEDARDCYFEQVDPEGNNPPQTISLVNYFRDKWDTEIEFQNLPCLELGKNNRSNKVPMEFCVVVEGQRYPKELLDKDRDKERPKYVKEITVAKPWMRKDAISEMLQAKDGPCGDVSKNFGIGVDMNMTKVVGRVIGAPELKLGGLNPVRVDAEKCQWNLLGKSFVDAKSIDRWALLDFTDGDRYNKLQASHFINSLMDRCKKLGIRMAPPLLNRVTRMMDLSSPNRLENLLKNVMDESSKISRGGKLQMIVCVMTKKDPGYKSLKWISETKIGVVTQCCLSPSANKCQDQYLANLCLKINVKLGGNNFELTSKNLHFDIGDYVMFIGADVNHPAPMNAACPSIAAVVGSINWPAANKYAAKVGPQAHRTEKIVNFGEMCLDLVNAYAGANRGIKPRKIVVFRDGVSDGQFGMLLEEELVDLKKAIYTDSYRPPITLIVAQKRHQTRLFPENRNDGGSSGNVPPGTVVDTKIVHPLDFDFYLCSHYGGLGTSKPTHYYVLWDENGFKSDRLQKLIYDMCFTFARCTKPVSLVPPVYYADLVAYRGRMFQEAAMEMSSGDISFNPSMYSTHSDLENIMFYV